MNVPIETTDDYQVMRMLERIGLEHLMQRFDYNQSRVAEVAGMNRSTLRKRLLAHGLPTTAPRYLKPRVLPRKSPHLSTLRV